MISTIDNGVRIQSLTKLTLLDLPEADRKAILDLVEELRDRDPATWPVDRVVHPPGQPTRYILRPTPELRLVLERDEQGRIVILDIMGERVYQWFLSQTSRNGSHEEV